MAETLTELLAEVRNCRACTDLPLGPRPVLRASATARVLIVGQAPGTRVHASGVPWDDPSGDRLRCWLALDRAAFYDQQRIAIIPMGLCYPGRGPSGDLPPRRACAELWFARLLEALPCIEVTVLAGQYAQAHYLGSARRRSLTETVRAFRDYAPRFFPTPHPSPRNTLWLRRNPWFEADVVPVVRAAVHRAIGTDPHPGRGHAATRDSTAGGDPTRS